MKSGTNHANTHIGIRAHLERGQSSLKSRPCRSDLGPTMCQVAVFNDMSPHNVFAVCFRGQPPNLNHGSSGLCETSVAHQRAAPYSTGAASNGPGPSAPGLDTESTGAAGEGSLQSSGIASTVCTEVRLWKWEIPSAYILWNWGARCSQQWARGNIRRARWWGVPGHPLCTAPRWPATGHRPWGHARYPRPRLCGAHRTRATYRNNRGDGICREGWLWPWGRWGGCHSEIQDTGQTRELGVREGLGRLYRNQNPWIYTLIARFTGPTRGPPGTEKSQVGPMNLAIWVVYWNQNFFIIPRPTKH